MMLKFLGGNNFNVSRLLGNNDREKRLTFFDKFQGLFVQPLGPSQRGALFKLDLFFITGCVNPDVINDHQCITFAAGTQLKIDIVAPQGGEVRNKIGDFIIIPDVVLGKLDLVISVSQGPPGLTLQQTETGQDRG